jgi:hypothetical protein
MRPAVLFNLDALFALIIGFTLLFNPLLGPVLPLPGGVVVALGLALLVAACLLGRAGMGKGSLVARIKTMGLVHVAIGTIIAAWAFLACEQGGRILALIVAGGLIVIGVAQCVAKASSKEATRTNARRGSPEELQQALRAGRR